MFHSREITSTFASAGIFRAGALKVRKRRQNLDARGAAARGHTLLAQWLNNFCLFSTHTAETASSQSSMQLARDLIDVLRPGRPISRASQRQNTRARIDEQDPILQPLPRVQQPRPPSYVINGPISRYTISKIMQQMVIETQYEKAVRYYNYKLRLGLRPDRRILMSRLRVSVALKDVDGAIRVLKQAERYQVRPDQEFFNLLISCCAASPKHASMVPRVVEKMSNYGLDVDAQTYVAIMTVYVETDQIKSALNLYFQITQRTNLRLPEKVEIRFLGALKRIGALEEAERVFGTLWKNLGNSSFTADPDVLSEAGTVGLDLYLKMGQTKRALDFWNEIRSKGIRPHSSMIVQLAESFKSQGMVHMARALLQQMRYHVMPTLQLYNVMIDVYGRHVSAEAALNKFEQLRRVYIPDASTMKSLFSMLLHMVVTRGSQLDLEAVMTKSKELIQVFSVEYNVDPAAHEDLSAVLIQLLCACGEIHLGVDAFLKFCAKDSRRSLLVPEAILEGMHRCKALNDQQYAEEKLWLRSAAVSALEGIEKDRLASTDLLLPQETMQTFINHVKNVVSYSE
jgi:pentatricopeptide repeat protein